MKDKNKSDINNKNGPIPPDKNKDLSPEEKVKFNCLGRITESEIKISRLEIDSLAELLLPEEKKDKKLWQKYFSTLFDEEYSEITSKEIRDPENRIWGIVDELESNTSYQNRLGKYR